MEENVSTTDRAERILRPFHIELSEGKIDDWTLGKLIPEKGKCEPILYIAEVCAAAYLLERCAWHENDVMVGRHHMRECIEGILDPMAKLDSFFEGLGIEAWAEQYSNGINWLLTVVKFLNNLPPNGGAWVRVFEAPGLGFGYEAEPARYDEISDAQGRKHPRNFKPAEAEIVPEGEAPLDTVHRLKRESA
jgi:hypothetical protein